MLVRAKCAGLLQRWYAAGQEKVWLRARRIRLSLTFETSILISIRDLIYNPLSRASATQCICSARIVLTIYPFEKPEEQADYIDTVAASETYATGSEVVGAGLRALLERDAAVEKWLRDEVVSVCDAMRSEPGRAISGEQVIAAIRARHADRLKTKRREPKA